MVYQPRVDSVARVEGPPPDEPSLRRALEALRERHAGAIFERYLDRVPQVDPTAFVAAGAAIVGEVTLGMEASVWFGCVLRGDVHRIDVGARSNLQDGVVVHLADAHPTRVGEDVVVGHRAVLHGCTIESGCLIGIGATILDGAHIGAGSVVGAGALVTPGCEVPPRSLVLGLPAKVVRTLGPQDEDMHRRLAAKYCRLAHNYRYG